MIQALNATFEGEHLPIAKAVPLQPHQRGLPIARQLDEAVNVTNSHLKSENRVLRSMVSDVSSLPFEASAYCEEQLDANTGRIYYIDHINRITSWDRPNAATSRKAAVLEAENAELKKQLQSGVPGENKNLFSKKRFLDRIFGKINQPVGPTSSPTTHLTSWKGPTGMLFSSPRFAPWLAEHY